MGCDICGRSVKSRPVTIEGAEVEACFGCVPKGEAKEKAKVEAKTIKPRKISEEDLTEDYIEKLKKALSGKDLKEFCATNNISESFMRNVLSGRVRPDLKTAKKLEKLLGIRITEKVEYVISDEGRGAKKELTMEENAVWE